MRISPQVTLPVGGPDSVKDLPLPGAVLLHGTNAARLTLILSAGAVDLTPCWWNETAQAWIPAQSSLATGAYMLSADFASLPQASDIFFKASEPQWWAVLASGGGTISYCDIEETVQ